jgi:hypothetical protein
MATYLITITPDGSAGAALATVQVDLSDGRARISTVTLHARPDAGTRLPSLELMRTVLTRSR